jgi:toxin ParE1/3/4
MKLEWTEPSLLDLESIRDYIIKDSAYYAARFIEKIIEAVESLREFPGMGRIVPEAENENYANFCFRAIASCIWWNQTEF